MSKFAKNYPLIRPILVIFILFGILVVYILKMIEISVVDADMYHEMLQGVTINTRPIKAVRGEIVDRNGNPIIQNQMSYNVIFDKAFLSDEIQNEIIFETIKLFESMNVSYIDNLPITQSEPFQFISNMESEVDILKKQKNAQTYTSATDMIYWLTEEYDLHEFSPQDIRKIAGVRYEMQQCDFSLKTPYIFARDVTNDVVVTVKEFAHKLVGIDVISVATRSYRDDYLATHILGTIGPLYKEEYERLKNDNKVFKSGQQPYDTHGYTLDDTIGKSGIEKALEDVLRGQNGLEEIHMSADRQVISVNESISPVSGNQVMLTIDNDMQLLAQESLEAQIKYLAATQPKGRGAEAHSGAVVVLNPKTGEILATASYPTYSIDEYKNDYGSILKADGTPLVNRAILGQYTPGSIYKPVVALAGLHEGALNENSTYVCTGTYHVYSPYRPKCLSTHGTINLKNAIGWSCNIFFYEAGRHTGIDAIDNMAQMLGLGEYTGVEIEEAEGQRSNPKIKKQYDNNQWTGADTIQTSIGQMYNRFSPLQLANYAATIANRGTRMKLTLVHEINDYNGQKIVKPFEPQIAYEMSGVKKENFETTINGMINATIGSAGGTFGGYPINVASKTGTPQADENTVNSTFIAFAPAEDPELAIAVVIEEGWQGYTGAPVAKAIFDDYFVIDHRGAVDSGPRRIKDYRESSDDKRTNTQNIKNAIEIVFPTVKNQENDAIVGSDLS